MELQASAVILAGGFSRRMGQPKAELPFGGGTMLSHQAARLREMGIRDLLVAGPEPGGERERAALQAAAPGIRFVPDIVPRRGPLSGIHAGLLAAACGKVLVLPVDMPLVPADLLCRMIEAHGSGITLTESAGRVQVLPAVLDRTLYPVCGKLLEGGGSTSLRALLALVPDRTVLPVGEEVFFMNCNTPEEYRAAVQAAENSRPDANGPGFRR